MQHIWKFTALPTMAAQPFAGLYGTDEEAVLYAAFLDDLHGHGPASFTAERMDSFPAEGMVSLDYALDRGREMFSDGYLALAALLRPEQSAHASEPPRPMTDHEFFSKILAWHDEAEAA